MIYCVEGCYRDIQRRQIQSKDNRGKGHIERVTAGEILTGLLLRHLLLNALWPLAGKRGNDIVLNANAFLNKLRLPEATEATGTFAALWPHFDITAFVHIRT